MWFQLRLTTGYFHQPLNHKWLESCRAQIHNNNLFSSFWNNFSWKDGFTLSNNDIFDNDKIFLCNIWHFSVITRINHISIFFCIFLKDTWKNFIVNISTIRNNYREVQSAIQYECVLQTLWTFWMKEFVCRERCFNWKRMHVANFTKVLNERECTSQTLHRF